MNGDWDVLCFESDHIVYDLAICDADGILLEKPSARTKVGIEITSQEVSQGLGRKKPIITQISPVVQFHNIREQIGSAQHNASIEFAIPKSRMFGKSSVTFVYSVKIFLNQQLVKVINADKILDQRRVVLQHYAKTASNTILQPSRKLFLLATAYCWILSRTMHYAALGSGIQRSRRLLSALVMIFQRQNLPCLQDQNLMPTTPFLVGQTS